MKLDEIRRLIAQVRDLDDDLPNCSGVREKLLEATEKLLAVAEAVKREHTHSDDYYGCGICKALVALTSAS